MGTESRLILADNYRSVLAAQRMKEALERVDSNALYILAGHSKNAWEGIARNRAIFDNELRVQEGNITEPGEREITSRLRVAWDGYHARHGYVSAAGHAGAAGARLLRDRRARVQARQAVARTTSWR